MENKKDNQEYDDEEKEFDEEEKRLRWTMIGVGIAIVVCTIVVICFWAEVISFVGFVADLIFIYDFFTKATKIDNNKL